MTDSDSITQWIAALKDGRETAAEHLWQRYFGRLTSLAQTRLATVGGPRGDAEDVALSVFKSLCQGAARQRFTKLVDRDNLWPLLVVMTSRKVTDVIRRENCQKRGGTNPPPVSLDDGRQVNLDELLSREPTPEMAAIMAENCERLLALLETVCREVAIAKLEGYSNREIAEKLGCGQRTVERKLHLARRLWEEANST